MSDRIAAAFDVNGLLLSALWIPVAASRSAFESVPSAPGLTDESYILLFGDSSNRYPFYGSSQPAQQSNLTIDQLHIDSSFTRHIQIGSDDIPIAVPISS